VIREKDLEGHLQNEKNIQARMMKIRYRWRSRKRHIQLQRAIDALKLGIIDKLKKKAA